jgi:isopenicillin N synthase-like dioxygenase
MVAMVVTLSVLQPSAYIHPTMTLQLPIFDISHVDKDAAVQLVQTASRYGFFYIKLRGSGIAPAEMGYMFDLVRLS